MAQHTASTLQAQMDVVRSQVDAAVQALDSETTEGGWGSARKASKSRAATAETALRQLSAIPPAE